MGDTVTTLNALMGEKFSKNVSRSFANEPILMNMLDGLSADEINQRGGRYPVQTRRQGSFQGGSENQSMPAPVNGEWLYWTPALKAAYSTGEFSGWSHWQTDVNTVEGRANRLKLGGMLGEKVASHLEDYKFFLDQCFFRDGKGKLADAIAARVVGAAGTATVTPGTANWTVDDIPIGARVNFYTSAGAIHNTAAAVSIVTGVNESTGVVTFDNVPTDAAVADFMVWEASWDLLPNGLAGLIQDQNVSFQGITVTNYPNLKGNLYQASGALDIKWVNRMQTRSKKRRGVKSPRNDYVIITHPKQVDAYRNAGYALNTVIGEANRGGTKLDLAYNRVAISGMDVYESNSSGERDLFGIRLKGLKRYELFAPNFLPLGDGESQYLVPVPGTATYKHQYQYYLAFYGNLLNTEPGAHFRIYDLDKTNLG
jgi:hypothetical protein